MRLARALAPLLLSVLAATPASAGDAGVPPFLCAPAKARPGGTRAPTLDVTDRFASRTLDLGRAAMACHAADAGGGACAGFPTHSRPRKARRVGAVVDVVDRFGTSQLTVKTLDVVLVPGTIATARADAAGGLRTCYRVGDAAPRRPRPRVVVTDGTVERVLDVGRPTRFCVPAEAGGGDELVCYAMRLARGKALAQAPLRPTTVTLSTRFGDQVLHVGPPRELCVAVDVPTPPARPFTLAIAPSSASAIAGERVRFTATAHFDDGTTADVTATVTWSSSDESVAHVVRSSAAGAFVEGVGPGTATIAVVDPGTGVSSGDGGSATLTVTWPLEKLTIAPHAVTKRPGDHESYTVTGHFTGGFTRNVTQRVLYASSDPAVAVATNQPGNRSLVEAVAQGDAVISATDPISGITTTDEGNDAELHVTGALSYVTITSNLRYSSRFPGQSQRFTARGYFADGSSVNLTQQCQWSSSDPAIAATPNPAGDRSRVDAIHPGLTFIGCTDPASGVTSSPTPFWVLGALVGIQAYGAGSPADWLRSGESLRLTAVGTYGGGGERNLTQELSWTSLDPAIASAPNPAGDRSRVDAVDGGDARIVAKDPATGITSNEVVVTVLGDLVTLYVNPLGYPGNVVPVGGTRNVRVSALYEHGSLRLPFDDPSFVIESSDPSVLAVVDGHQLLGVAAGVATIVARDVATGQVSAGLQVTVKGDLDAITLDPPSATRGIGEWETFTAIGHFPPSFTELMTQRLVYASSDTAVAVADNAPPSRSRIRTVGAGTATITATDPATGISGTATITVLPGTIERVTIEPATIVRNPGNVFSYTAIGHYPDGSTINVTQIVTWSSLAPDVAQATNQPGNRSRVVAGVPGTAQISARHPSGVSSHDTGDDATFVTKALKAAVLTPATYTGHVGDVLRYTFVGVFTDDTTINLTQSAAYGADSTNIAVSDGTDGDRSAIRLTGPGTTTVSARAGTWDDDLFSSPVVAPFAEASLTVEP